MPYHVPLRVLLCSPSVSCYLQFYICDFIFVIFCNIVKWGPHHTTSVSRNQLDLAFYVGLQDSCSCLRYLLPVTLPANPVRAGLPSPLPTAAPQLMLSLLPALLPQGLPCFFILGFLAFIFLSVARSRPQCSHHCGTVGSIHFIARFRFAGSQSPDLPKH